MEKQPSPVPVPVLAPLPTSSTPEEKQEQPQEQPQSATEEGSCTHHYDSDTENTSSESDVEGPALDAEDVWPVIDNTSDAQTMPLLSAHGVLCEAPEAVPAAAPEAAKQPEPAQKTATGKQWLSVTPSTSARSNIRLKPPRSSSPATAAPAPAQELVAAAAAAEEATPAQEVEGTPAAKEAAVTAAAVEEPSADAAPAAKEAEPETKTAPAEPAKPPQQQQQQQQQPARPQLKLPTAQRTYNIILPNSVIKPTRQCPERLHSDQVVVKSVEYNPFYEDSKRVAYNPLYGSSSDESDTD